MIYLASPFFTEKQIKLEEKVKNKLRELGFEVWSPKENCVCESYTSLEKRQKVFEDNLKAIDNSDIVFAITNDKDMGTLFECGYAFSKKKKVVYYCDVLNEGKFNLMLSQSAFAVLMKFSQIENLEYLIKNGGNVYNGYIE